MCRHVANKTYLALICPDVVLSEPVCSPPLCSLCAPAVSVKSDARCSNGPLWVPYLAFSLCDSIKFLFLLLLFFFTVSFYTTCRFLRASKVKSSGAQAILLVWFQLVLFPLYSSLEEKNTALWHSSSSFLLSLCIFTRSWPFIWELVRTLDNRRPAGVGSDSVIFILTFGCFLLAISGVKTLQSWPLATASLSALTNQTINSSQNDQISLCSDFDRFWKAVTRILSQLLEST